MLHQPVFKYRQASRLHEATKTRIAERYSMGPEFEDMGRLKDREGEPFVVNGKGVIDEEKRRDNEPGLPNWKRLRQASHEADDEDCDERSHRNLKKSRRYVIVSDSASK